MKAMQAKSSAPQNRISRKTTNFPNINQLHSEQPKEARQFWKYLINELSTEALELTIERKREKRRHISSEHNESHVGSKKQ